MHNANYGVTLMLRNFRIKGLSDKEIQIVSYLELEGRRFFTKPDIGHFFKSRQNLNWQLHKLKSKGRVIRINKNKYYLIPIQAHTGWAEHPFIVADELFNGKNYYIGGKTAANYWGWIDQLPAVVDVFSASKQGTKKILGTVFKFRRVRKMEKAVKRKMKDGHEFWIAGKQESKQWI